MELKGHSTLFGRTNTDLKVVKEALEKIINASGNGQVLTIAEQALEKGH